MDGVPRAPPVGGRGDDTLDILAEQEAGRGELFGCSADAAEAIIVSWRKLSTASRGSALPTWRLSTRYRIEKPPGTSIGPATWPTCISCAAWASGAGSVSVRTHDRSPPTARVEASEN